MRRDLLEVLENHLRTVKPEEFNLCGWAGCAIGHAATLPEFQAEGLVMEVRGMLKLEVPCRGEDRAWEAIRSLFGLSEDRRDVIYLFHADEYASGRKTTPTEVADRIRKFLDDHPE